MRSATAWLLAGAALPAIIARAYGGSTYSAAPSGPPPVAVEYLDVSSHQLQQEVAQGLPEEDLYKRARSLFERIPRPETTEIGPVPLRGWSKPDPRPEAKTGDVQGFRDAVKNTLSTREVPPPARDALYMAYRAGNRLQDEGKVRFDGEDGRRRLPDDRVMGAYVYTPREPVGIFYNPVLRFIARFVGNKIAGSTMVHEDDHARRDAEGDLNPMRVTDGEEEAFKTQYQYLKAADPTGPELTWLLVNYGPANPLAPPMVSEYLKHVSMILLYGDKGDFPGLVRALGYEDPHGHQHLEADGHESPR